jgi:hypothetical protein
MAVLAVVLVELVLAALWVLVLAVVLVGMQLLSEPIQLLLCLFLQQAVKVLKAVLEVLQMARLGQQETAALESMALAVVAVVLALLLAVAKVHQAAVAVLLVLLVVLEQQILAAVVLVVKEQRLADLVAQDTVALLIGHKEINNG